MPQNKNHTTQKTTHYGEQKPERVAEYKEQIKKYPNEKRIYVDEAGFDSYLYRKYARAPKGQKVNEAIKGNKNERTSIVAVKMGHDIIAPLQYISIKEQCTGIFLRHGLKNICFLMSPKTEW